ncbi:MAG: acyl carrier protein [Mucinivorans sp.]
MLEKVIQLMARVYKIDPSTITRSTDFQKDLKLDSMSLVQSVIEIEDEYGIEIPERKLFKMKTVGDLVDYLDKIFPKGAKVLA